MLHRERVPSEEIESGIKMKVYLLNIILSFIINFLFYYHKSNITLQLQINKFKS